MTQIEQLRQAAERQEIYRNSRDCGQLNRNAEPYLASMLALDFPSLLADLERAERMEKENKHLRGLLRRAADEMREAGRHKSAWSEIDAALAPAAKEG